MASTLLFLSVSSASSSVVRHWTLAIFLSTLLLLENPNGMFVLGEPTMKIYSDDHATDLTASTTPLELLPYVNRTIDSNPLVTIPLTLIPNIADIRQVLKVSASNGVNATQFIIEIQSDNTAGHRSLSEVILYGFLGVTVTNMCALMGLVCIPLRKSKHYNHLLSFMTALAVGALCSTAVLVLIPEALRMVDMPAEFGGMGRRYLLKFTCVLAGALLFYIIEYTLIILPRLLQWNVPSDGEVPEGRADRQHHGHSHSVNGLPGDVTGDGDSSNKSVSTNVSSSKVDGSSAEAIDSPDNSVISSSAPRRRRRCCLPAIRKETLSSIAPVAWMILFGDGFHNLMDGLTIGAGFTESPTVGLTLVLSILFEELPHELGDFAILLSSGMSVKAAICSNFLSACAAYIGLAIGIVIGEVSSGAFYVLAVTGGFFLYISLSDMLPVMRAGIEELEGRNRNSLGLFLLQLLGMLVGFVCIVGVTMVSDYIVF